MKKTLIALAVAGFVAAPAAMAEVTVYGQAHVSLDNWSGDGAVHNNQSLAVTNRASRVGVKAAEDLGGGLTAVAQMEWGVDMTGDASATNIGADNNITARNQIVALAGSFGTVAMGRHDTPYKISTGSLDVFADTAADYNNIIGTNYVGGVGFDSRPGQVLAYLSPDFGGFTFQAAIVAADVADASGDDSDAADATSIAGEFKNGPLFVSLAMEQYADTAGGALDGGDAPSSMKLGVGYDFGAVKLGVVGESQKNVGAADDDVTAALVNVAIPMGGNTVIIEAGQNKAKDADATVTLAAVGLAHGFSKNTSAYAAFGNVNVDTGSSTSDNVLTAGMVVKF
jgi:predicted porin